MSFSNAARIAQVTQPHKLHAADVPAASGLADAAEETVVTELQTAAGAIAVHARLADLLDPAFRSWSAFVPGFDFRVALGETVRVSHPRFGLAAGKDFIVTGTRDVAGEGVELTLLGGKV
ncbi:MAG: hypothetical protein ACE5EM_12480 [Sphingomonadales bacterium]